MGLHQFRRVGIVIGLAFLLIAADAANVPVAVKAAPSAWPVFRGNLLETGIAAAALPDDLVIRWMFQIKDSIEGTAAIDNGTVYVGAMDEHLYALDLATGKEKWRYKAAPIKVSPAVRDRAVYVGDLDGIFHCVDAATGKLRWKFDTEAEITSGASFAGDNVLFGSSDESLYCLSKDGKKLWQFKVPGGPVLATPAVAAGHTFVSGCDSNLHVLDLATGKEQRSVNLDGQTGATPAVLGDYLYVGTMSNQLLAVNWKKGEVAWRFEAPRRQQPFFSSAAVTDNLVIAGSRDKQVYALDRASGKEVWHFATKNKVDGSPVVAGQRVYIGSFDGFLYVLDLAKGTEVKQFRLAKRGPIIASPAVADGCLVIGTNDGTVYCLGAKQ
jgi:outer membrane protein assembly factor BamB